MTGGAEELGELGDFCQTGCCGVTIDLEAAAEYFRMGSEGGDPVSMFHLGVCLRDDGYVEQAQFWLRKSAQLEHRQAAKLLLLQKNPCETPVDHSHPQANRSISAGNGSQAVRDIEALQQQNEDLKEKVAKLERDKEELKEALCQERNSVENLWTDITRYKTIVSTMTALISATSADFTVDRLLGTGSNAAVFKVQFHTSNLSASSITSTTQSAYSYSRMGEPENRTRTRDMVMKALFNWETTPQHTMLRQKYMAECVILSLVPGHPNVIHPLGALVLPCLPLDFVDKIPIEKPFYRELSRYKTLVVLMPYAGIPLPSFFSSLVTTSPSATTVIEISKSLFVQGLKAIHHIESCAVVHRDIKADNILIDPESHKLTLIDFGEAQHCPNMELSVSATMNAWGNTGTIPPELSIFLQGRTRGATGVFSYSKCDSFALALTFWDVFLPPTNKFIGSLLNQNMSSFTTPALLNKFPVMLFSSAAILPINNNLRVGDMLLSKMIEMMHPKKDARLSAYDALSQLLNL
ncbi:hypothetical protein Pelo_17383 [Pelomyxa schiedti]|nr:hypothetical protein Pelo_17383 [Pelomyxa schiedti]